MLRDITKKFLSLGLGELAAVIAFAGVWILYLSRYEWAELFLGSWSALYVFGVLEFLLLQGSCYWLLKWKQVRRGGDARLPRGQVRVFAWLKWVNAGLLVVGVGIVVYQVVVLPLVVVWVLLVYVFAVAEYVNYYHVRLSYPRIGRIADVMRGRNVRVSKLGEELRELQYVDKKKGFL